MLWTVDMHKSTNPRLLGKEHGDSAVVWVRLVEVGMDKALMVLGSILRSDVSTPTYRLISTQISTSVDGPLCHSTGLVAEANVPCVKIYPDDITLRHRGVARTRAFSDGETFGSAST